MASVLKGQQHPGTIRQQQATFKQLGGCRRPLKQLAWLSCLAAAATAGEAKGNGSCLREVVLGVLAGCFIGFGFSTCMLAAGQVRPAATGWVGQHGSSWQLMVSQHGHVFNCSRSGLQRHSMLPGRTTGSWLAACCNRQDGVLRLYQPCYCCQMHSLLVYHCSTPAAAACLLNLSWNNF